MSRVARFPVLALLTRSRPEKGMVEITRDAKPMISVRPYRMHRTYSMLLEDVASIIVRTITIAEHNEKKRAKAAKKKGRG